MHFHSPDMHPRTRIAITKVLEHFERGDKQAATESSHELLRSHPDLCNVCLTMAEELFVRQFHTVAIRFLDICASLAPYDPRPWQLRATIEQQMGDTDASERSQAIANQREKTGTLFNIAEEHFAQNRPQVALSRLQEATRHDPTNYHLHMHLAKQAYDCGVMTVSIENFMKAHHLDPQDHSPLWGLARVLFHQGRKDQALEVLEKAMVRAVKRDPVLAQKCEGRIATMTPFLSIEGWCNAQGYSFLQLVEPECVRIREPPILNARSNGPPRSPRLSETQEATAPGLWIAELHDVEVIGSEGVLFVKDQQLLYDPALHPQLNQDNSPSHTGLVHNQHTVLLLPQEESSSMKDAILLGGRACYNYFHWLTEFLPKILLIDSIVGYEQAPLLLPADLAPQMMESLDLVDTHKRPRVMMHQNTRIKVANLLVPAPTALLYDDPRMKKTSLMVVPAAVSALRNRLNVPSQIDRQQTKPRRVFMRRIVDKNLRQVVNEPELVSLFAEYGFESVDTSKMTFTQQVELFRDCEAIVGAAGATFANMMLTPGGCTSILLGSRHVGPPYLFDSIARASEQSLLCIFGEPIESLENENPAHFSCWIDPDETRRSMDHIMRSIETSSS